MMKQETAIVEQEVIYVTFLDPDNFEPHLTFFTVTELNKSQDAQGLKRALFNFFDDHAIDSILNKMVFLASNRASVNRGLSADLITLLK